MSRGIAGLPFAVLVLLFILERASLAQEEAKTVTDLAWIVTHHWDWSLLLASIARA